MKKVDKKKYIEACKYLYKYTEQQAIRSYNYSSDEYHYHIIYNYEYIRNLSK